MANEYVQQSIYFKWVFSSPCVIESSFSLRPNASEKQGQLQGYFPQLLECSSTLSFKLISIIYSLQGSHYILSHLLCRLGRGHSSLGILNIVSTSKHLAEMIPVESPESMPRNLSGNK